MLISGSLAELAEAGSIRVMHRHGDGAGVVGKTAQTHEITGLTNDVAMSD